MSDDHWSAPVNRAGGTSLDDDTLRLVHGWREAGMQWVDIDARLDREGSVKSAYLRAARGGALAAALGMVAVAEAEPPARPAPQAVEVAGAASHAAPHGAAFETHGQHAHVVRLRARRTAGWEQYILLTSDHHWDHPECDRDLLAYHLDLAADRAAGVVVAGDLFCVMQGRNDRRGGKGQVRPEHQVDRYFDAVVDTAVEWYRPYAPYLWMISAGNHESAIQKHLETDLTARLCEGLARHGSPVMQGSYAGYLTLLCDDGERVQPIRMLWDHGSGGGGPVTKGVIGTNRRGAAYDADVILTGHVHESWVVQLMREGVDDLGRPYVRPQDHVCCAGYKRESGLGNGWHVETGKRAKPSGAWWMRLYWSPREGAVRWTFAGVES